MLEITSHYTAANRQTRNFHLCSTVSDHKSIWYTCITIMYKELKVPERLLYADGKCK